MALIKIGSIDNLSVCAKGPSIQKMPYLKGIQKFSELNEVSNDIAPDSFELCTSTDQRGLALKNIKLNEGFEGFLQGFLNKKNEIYFVAWAWDLSGQPVNLYPGQNFSTTDVLIPITVGNVREFIGQGINLFPKQTVKGGIAIRIQLWECDKATSDLGKAMIETADAISNSKLNNLLSLISLATGVTGVTIKMVEDASIELAKVIGLILKTNGDDAVDYFEGYYASDQPWTVKDEQYQGNASEITLNKY